MKRIILTLIVTFGLTNLVNAQEFIWERNIVGGDLAALQRDVNGNVYALISSIGGTAVTIDNTVYSFNDVTPLYTQDTLIKNYAILKFDSSGNFLFKTNFIKRYSDYSSAFAIEGFSVDYNGNMYIRYFFSDKNEAGLYIKNGPSSYKTIDGRNLSKDRVVFKIDSSGKYAWDINFGFLHNGSNVFIQASQSSNDVYVLTNEMAYIAFDKFDANGQFSYTCETVVENGNPARPQGYCETNDGDYFYTASWAFSENDSTKAYITKFSSSTGEIVRTDVPGTNNVAGPSPFLQGESVCLDINDNIYTSGRGKGFDSIFGLPSSPDIIGHVIKLNSNHEAEWILQTDMTRLNVSAGTDRIYVSGLNKAGENFDKYQFAESGLFYAEIDFNGNILIAESYNSTYNPLQYRPYTSAPNGLLLGSNKSFGIVESTINRITGKIYYDFNSNNQEDANEYGAKNVLLDVNNKLISSGKDGDYIVSAYEEKYIIEPNTLKYYNIVPVKDSAEFTSTDSTAVINFALQPVGNINDLEVYLTDVTPARPGFNVIYRLTAKNVGTTVLNPTIKLVYDSLLTFENAGPPETTDTYPELTWNLANLKPGDIKNFTVRFKLAEPPEANFGDTLVNIVEIGPDENDTTENNNRDTIEHRVTGSYDPNIKETNKPEVINVEDVNGSFAIDYTIHFQNTGNDTAFHVYLIDSLDEDLKVETIEVLSASHDYEMSISENNTLRWDYYNILLVDSNTNEPESHGFVKYRVWTKDNSGLGDEFTNFADIYFDFNEPVRTNTTSNRIDKVESVQLVKGTSVIVYPNPSNGIFTVKAHIKAGTKTKLEVIDLTGKIVYTEDTKATTNGLETKIDINTLSQGVYFIKVYAGNEVFTAKIIKS